MRTVTAPANPHAGDDLWQIFVDPPDDARPRAWWHWMDGNIDPAGIVRDLTWLHEVGVGGVQLFDGGMGVPLVVPEAVRPGSAAWADAVDTAVGTAEDLGLELAVATSSGWSAAGGPWVVPEDAMKKVVWSETVIEGGDAVEIALTPLPAVAGLYQDSPREGGSDVSGFATDWVVLALPHRAGNEALQPAEVAASVPISDPGRLMDGSFREALVLPRDPDGWSQAWIEQRFDEPVTVCSVVVGLPGPRGFGAAPAADAVLQVSDDGVRYREVVRLDPTTVPARTGAFGPVTGRRFRLMLSGGSAADALPPTSPGVRLPPVLRRAHEFAVSQFALRPDARVHAAEVKAGFGVVPDYYGIDGDEDAGATAPDDVIDLTSCVRNGVLRWSAPPGQWLILRLGASLTGQTNGPAPRDSTGLEVDKLDGARVSAYLASHLARFGGTDAAPARFAALLSDSIEAGPQNWTDGIREQFRSRRGYDPLLWLPTLTGRLISDAAKSDRFLFDYRRTLAELLAEQYYGTLGSEARRRGMTYYAEALEDGRPSLGDDLAMRAAADVPMGAMWTFTPDAGPRPTYVADLKGAASVAHVHGKRWVGSEAFTSFDNPWSWTPRTLKHIADLQLSLGVTRFCIHTSPHQPLAAPAPGIALAPFLGQSFTANETWAGMARPWVDYLARCSALLNAGRPAVDIAVFVGEEAPVTALFDDHLDEAVPPGFDFDYVGADGLSLLTVDADGLRSVGARYRVLYLGGSSRRMTLKALRGIETLLDQGATVVGPRPESSPSLADDDDEFASACHRMWALPRARGRLIPTSDLRAALTELGMRSDFEIVGAPLRSIARLVDGRRVTFLANPLGDEVRARIIVPAEAGSLSAWDPVDLTATPLAGRPDPDGRTSFDVTLPAFGSAFIVPGLPERRRETASPHCVSLEGGWTLLIGQDEIDLPDGPRLWTDLSDEARAFSGTATYRCRFIAPPVSAGGRVCLSLGEVRDIARVVVNGVDCGVGWTAPFEIDVTSAVREGDNRLEVRVATPWRNRLIAEAAHPTAEIFPPMASVFEPSAVPLRAGLTGPVVLRIDQ